MSTMTKEIEKKISSYKSASIAIGVLGATLLGMGIFVLFGFSLAEPFTMDEITAANWLGVNETTVDKMIAAKVVLESMDNIGMILIAAGIVGVGIGIAIEYIVKDLSKRSKES